MKSTGQRSPAVFLCCHMLSSTMYTAKVASGIERVTLYISRLLAAQLSNIIREGSSLRLRTWTKTSVDHLEDFIKVNEEIVDLENQLKLLDILEDD